MAALTIITPVWVYTKYYSMSRERLKAGERPNQKIHKRGIPMTAKAGLGMSVATTETKYR